MYKKKKKKNLEPAISRSPSHLFTTLVMSQGFINITYFLNKFLGRLRLILTIYLMDDILIQQINKNIDLLLKVVILLYIFLSN